MSLVFTRYSIQLIQLCLKMSQQTWRRVLPPCPYMDSTRTPWRERGTTEWTAGEITAYKASPNVLLEIKDGMRVDSRQVCRIFATLFASILVWFVFFFKKKEALRLAILTIWLLDGICPWFLSVCLIVSVYVSFCVSVCFCLLVCLSVSLSTVFHA